MSVSVKIINKSVDVNNHEYLASIRLKELLDSSFDSSTNGEICIAYGLTLGGQEVRDVDIFMFGALDNYVLPNYYANAPQYPKKDLKVEGFCIAIELKEHPYHRIAYSNTHILVEYNDQYKDATEQNEKQRYSCSNWLVNTLGYSVYVTNFLWLKNLSSSQLKSMVDSSPIGALPDCFTFQDIISVIISQGNVPVFNNIDHCYHLHPCCNYTSFIDDIKKADFSLKYPPKGLTKQRLETLAQQRVQSQLGQIGIGKRLTIFHGRAGTGKTFRLIQSALMLANPTTGSRCILLTYNHALVTDIRRLFHYMDIPDGIDNYTIQVQTLHSFFMQLMRSLNIDTQKITGDCFEDEYKKALHELNVYVGELMDNSDIKTLKEDNKLAIDWDYVLIDEAQDWSEEERDILFKVYGKDKIIIADGVDQFMRGNKKITWASKDAIIEDRKQGMRQKTNLVNFVNELASNLGLKWNVIPNKDTNWRGGEIIVRDKYDSKFHEKLTQYCEESGCENYDILFLIPHQMKPSNTVEEKGIKVIDINLWEKANIKLFDGTSVSKRKQYSTDLRQCRLFQYESCRGLEGWITVCLNYDVLIENKFKEIGPNIPVDTFSLESPEEALRKFVYTWALMPLTRPIDTLVITLHDKDSEIGLLLKQLHEKNPDTIRWEIDE